jgi:dihydropteroate synthase
VGCLRLGTREWEPGSFGIMAVADKDFIGETLALPVDQRAEGTLATLAVCAWLGARIFRVHDVPATRAALSAVTAMRAPAA